MTLAQEGTEIGKPVIPEALEGFVAASHTHGLKMRVSMASVQSIRPSKQTRILEVPLAQGPVSSSGTGTIQILSVRAYRPDGKPAHVEIRATPMLSTQDGKLNTTA
jgi:hypothetical protein